MTEASAHYACVNRAITAKELEFFSVFQTLKLSDQVVAGRLEYIRNHLND